MKITSLFFSTLVSYLILYIILPFFEKYFLDIPNERSSHSDPKPTGGGVVFALIGSLGYLFNGDMLPLICLPLSIIGLIDDYLKLNSWFRYFVQILTAISIIEITDFIELFDINFPLIFIYLIIIIFITAMINLVNFMDGIDGLLAGCMIVVFATLGFASNINVFILLGSILGFIILNWYPSKIFMGDVGSTFLGAFYAGLVLRSGSLVESLWIISLSFPLLFDSSICILRRYFAGLNIFSPHRLHLFQRLNRVGWNHSKISSLYIAISILFSFSYVMHSLAFLMFNIFLMIFIGTWLDMNIAVPFNRNQISIENDLS